VTAAIGGRPAIPIGEIIGSRHVVYRLYGVLGDLLYVGRTRCLTLRLFGHKVGQKWWGEVAFVTTEEFATEAQCLRAEGIAIQTEKSRYNKAGAILNQGGRVEAAQGPTKRMAPLPSADREEVRPSLVPSIRDDPTGQDLTVKEIAQYLRVDDSLVYAAVHSGQLPSYRVGRVIRIPPKGLDNLLVPPRPEWAA
jgi:excisionase family DNA binding protein